MTEGWDPNKKQPFAVCPGDSSVDDRQCQVRRLQFNTSFYLACLTIFPISIQMGTNKMIVTSEKVRTTWIPPATSEAALHSSGGLQVVLKNMLESIVRIKPAPIADRSNEAIVFSMIRIIGMVQV